MEGRRYNLSVGTPDFKPAPHIMEAVSEAAKDPKNYKYALTELPELIEAMQNFYKRRFDVELAADEIMSLYGSQEGMAHLAWALCNPGDLVLVPNPGIRSSASDRSCAMQKYGSIRFLRKITFFRYFQRSRRMWRSRQNTWWSAIRPTRSAAPRRSLFTGN